MDYNKIAPFYESLSRMVFGNSLIKSQGVFIESIPPNATILIIGGGSGKFLKELLSKSSCKKILYIDSSSEMLKLAKKKIAGLNYSAEIEFMLGTEKDILPDERFDTIITYCFLDLFNSKELDQVAQKLTQVLREDGIWLVADFRINPHPFHKLWQGLLVKVLYLFFRITTGMTNNKLPELDDHFERNYFKRINIKYFYKGMIFSTVYKKIINTEKNVEI
jgi:tRNA (cmo5U34)-methyltransferase